MSKDSNEGTPAPTGKSPASVLILSIADTTWRMFIPVIGCLLLGRLADNYWHTKPLGMIIGIVLGCVITGLLIKRLFEKEV
jgi:hypothetical protein